MGSGKDKGKGYTPSSGQKKARKNRRAIRLTERKIVRWGLNLAAGKPGNTKRKGRGAKKPQRLGGKVANRNTWNTEGLQRKLDELKGKK